MTTSGDTNQLNRLCVFCGSSPGSDPAFLAAATMLGTYLAVYNIGLVYGGGRVGLMGAVADATLAAGGEVIGVIPQALVAKEVAHQRLTDLRIVSSMHERKALMAELADGFMALPGGCGTFEELLEILTWAQLGLHAKPCAILNVNGFYDGLRTLLDHAVAQRFVRAEHLDMILIGTTVEDLVGRMRTYQPPRVEKWIDREQT